MCENCNVVNGEREKISIQRISSPISLSQYVSPISSSDTTPNLVESIINFINTLLKNDETSLDDFQHVKECEEFLHLHLIHLHTKTHNMLSLNIPLGKAKPFHCR